MAATLFMKVGHVTVKWPRDLCPLVRVPLPPPTTAKVLQMDQGERLGANVWTDLRSQCCRCVTAR